MSLEDAEIRSEHERLAPFEALARLVIMRRAALGLSQEELATRMHTTASAIHASSQAHTQPTHAPSHGSPTHSTPAPSSASNTDLPQNHNASSWCSEHTHKARHAPASASSIRRVACARRIIVGPGPTQPRQSPPRSCCQAVNGSRSPQRPQRYCVRRTPHHERRRFGSIRCCARIAESVAGATRSSRRPRRGRLPIEAPANAASSTIPRM